VLDRGVERGEETEAHVELLAAWDVELEQAHVLR
jgi:hypothetical protein